jgi:hypothetical protein
MRRRRRHRGHTGSVPSFRASTTQTSSTISANASRISEKRHVSRFCLRHIGWCVDRTGPSSPIRPGHQKCARPVKSTNSAWDPDAASKRVSAGLGVRVVIDADTEGVADTPAISEPGLRKINSCDLFWADLTFVATHPDCRRAAGREAVVSLQAGTRFGVGSNGNPG